jgi:23S rRNA pseudouridine1911/1915/1917 synthase
MIPDPGQPAFLARIGIHDITPKKYYLMMNNGWIYSDRITLKTSGLTVLQYYSEHYNHSSLAEWENRIRSGEIQLDNRHCNPDDILQVSQTLAYHRPPWEEPEVPRSIEILYEDDDLVVVDKPSGLPVMPGGGFLENTLLRILARSYLENPPIPIHRLGRGTSGLMVLGRTSAAKSELTRQMRDREIQKVYLALASGVIEDDEISISTRIGKVPHPVLGELFAASEMGLAAESVVRVLERRSDSTLAEVEIFTGRPHQIRIHLASVGHPLVGDPLYGLGGQAIVAAAWDEIAVPGDCGYFLQAHRLGFWHPRSRDWREWVAPTPTWVEATERSKG